MDRYAIMLVKPVPLDFNRSIGSVVDEISDMIEAADLKIDSFQYIMVRQDQAKNLYAKHRESNYFPWLITQITSSPVGIFLIQGDNASRRARDLAFKIRELLMPIGETLELSQQEKRAWYTVIYTSDPDEEGAAEREGAIFFPMFFGSNC